MKQILIVEDDELLNKMLVYNLQSESYGIVSVETVKEAMEVLKSQPFDLVLLDINLPDGDGYAIAKTIRKKYSDTIVIFLTANDRESGVWDIQVPNQIRLKWASMSSWGIIVKHWLMIIIPIICGTVQNV